MYIEIFRWCVAFLYFLEFWFNFSEVSCYLTNLNLGESSVCVRILLGKKSQTETCFADVMLAVRCWMFLIALPDEAPCTFPRDFVSLCVLRQPIVFFLTLHARDEMYYLEWLSSFAGFCERGESVNVSLSTELSSGVHTSALAVTLAMRAHLNRVIYK